MSHIQIHRGIWLVGIGCGRLTAVSRELSVVDRGKG